VSIGLHYKVKNKSSENVSVIKKPAKNGSSVRGNELSDQPRLIIQPICTWNPLVVGPTKFTFSPQ